MRGPLCAFLLAVSLTVSGCGGGDGDAGSGGENDDPSASATAAYFVRADTDAINAAAVKAQKTGAQAQAAKAQAACNKAGNRGYEQWRTRWAAGRRSWPVTNRRSPAWSR